MFWRQFFALEPAWEATLYEALASLRTEADFAVVDERNDTQADALILLYPAVAHRDLRDSPALDLFLSAHASQPHQRVLLVACSLASPDISHEDVHALLNRHGSPATKNGVRCRDVDHFDRELQTCLRLTLTRARLLVPRDATPPVPTPPVPVRRRRPRLGL